MGGDGGCSVGVNEGSNGGSGESSTFGISNTILALAEGGTGGEKGFVSCGCGNVGGGGNYNECDGWYNGNNGTAGVITNFVPAVSAPILPSYIPNDYLTPTVNCCSLGGNGGSDFSGCLILNDLGNNYPAIEEGASSGQDGESGFIVISF